MSFIIVESWAQHEPVSEASNVLGTKRLGFDAARAHNYSALRDVVLTAVFFHVIADALSIGDSDAFVENSPANLATCSDGAVKLRNQGHPKLRSTLGPHANHSRP